MPSYTPRIPLFFAIASKIISTMSTPRAAFTFSTGQRLEIATGDLTLEPLDAIVNAANADLQHGGGVAAAIARRGGPNIQRESDIWVRQHGPVSHADPAVTSAGEMPSRYVIHAVGPIWGEGDEDAKLVTAVQGSLRTADQLGLQSLALPAISMGIYGFPKTRGAPLLLDAIRDYFDHNPASGLRLVRVTLFDEALTAFFVDALAKWPGAQRLDAA
jgi:O-acetyl-ADP-ribose deacetylase (regulator of RNase III)